ncbi:hypothetical protein KRR38_34550 [Novosphingobium sp. G106]|uniref:hypothetical protein n=1 Tax=Novosphingobium sp. G106 TaxID=2849500 RepID=UPI001C2D9ABA|nr:hypothetical protein [Novosphingobium sp. G106]MBV1692614.1 hypothetical protein [Novosphingobium sp. G106]
MHCLIETLHRHGIQSAHRMAIDPIVDFPIDYRLLSELVKVLASDLAGLYNPARPVAVQLDHGLALALLDLSLIAAGIPQLTISSACSASDAATAMAWSGAQAVYLNATDMVRLRHAIPMTPMPAGTGRVTFRSIRSRKDKQVCVPLRYLFEIAASLVDLSEPGHFDRHLALQPTWMLSEAIAGFYATILAGGTYVMPPAKRIGLANPNRPDFERMVDSIAEMRITSLVLEPTLLAGLTGVLEARGRRLPMLARVIVSGGPAPRALIERSRTLGLPVRVVEDLARSTWMAAFEDRPEMAEGRG